MTLEGISAGGRACTLRSPEEHREFDAPKGGEVARRFLQKKISGKLEWPRRRSPSLDAWLLERDEDEAAIVSETAHCNRMAMEQRSPPPPPGLNGSERRAASAVLRRTEGSPHHRHSGAGAIADHEGGESAAAAKTAAEQSPASDPAGELGMRGFLDELELLIIRSGNEEMIARFFITLD